MARVFVGTSSWSQHTDFYPPGLRSTEQITFYAQHFPLVEINSTYYAMQPLRNYAAWAKRTPEGFLFDVKPFKQLTWHDRGNPPDDALAAQFRESLQPLRDAGKLRALNYQFPPWFVYKSDNLDYIKHVRDQWSDALSIEFRHRSWLEGDHVAGLTETLRSWGVGLTVVDEPQIGSGSVPTVLAVTSPSLAIVRFHGRNAAKWYAKVESTGERFDYLYSEEELRQWVPNLAALGAEAQEIHVLFNNNARDYAVRNGRQLQLVLREMLPEHETVLPPAPPALDGTAMASL
ncbi:MAG: DUF72 domain-containing protein [Chloroflexi bacterium]|nr:DUF72 domain-containing protein [Chloroflexota bacterium]